MKLDKIIYNIKNLYNKGIASDEFNLTDRQVAFIVNYLRASLIDDKLAELTNVEAQELEQRVYLDLEQVDTSEEYNDDVNAFILKSIQPLGEIMHVTRIETLTNTPIQPVTKAKSYWYKKYNKFTAGRKGWYIDNNHLYVTNNCLLENVRATVISADPMKIESLNNPTCYTSFDWDYPMPQKFMRKMLFLLRQTEISIYMNAIKDLQLDGTDDSAKQGSN